MKADQFNFILSRVVEQSAALHCEWPMVAYGSSGKGGALCVGLQKSFGLRKKEGVIKDFIAGEDFSIFNDTVLTLLEAVPGLRVDSDVNTTNEGVTFLWLK